MWMCPCWHAICRGEFPRASRIFTWNIQHRQNWLLLLSFENRTFRVGKLSRITAPNVGNDELLFQRDGASGKASAS